MKPSNYSSLNEQTVLYRRELHRIPETGTDLPLTSSYLKKQLTALGVPFVSNQKDSGLIAFLDTGTSGKTLAFRADMDALPVMEETGLPFASTNGNMHACGHDAHMAILLSTISYLKEHLYEFHGKFLFLFQTGEEISSAASACIAVCQIHGGSTYNCIPSECDLEGTIRALSADMRSFLWQRVTEISELTARSLRATATVNIIPGAPALINDVSSFSLLKKAVFSHTIILNFRLMKMSYSGAALCFLKQHDRQPNFFPV